MEFSKTVGGVIALTRAIQAYWDSELPKRHRNYPLIAPGEESGPPPPEQEKLNELLQSLPDQDVYKLLLLMYLGRGDFGADDLETQYKVVKQRFRDPSWAISQLMGKAPLADYLEDGLEKIKESHIDVDDLFASVKSGR